MPPEQFRLFHLMLDVQFLKPFPNNNWKNVQPSRPFRIVTGSEDNSAAVYEGPPFKFKSTKNEHTRYCQVAKRSFNRLVGGELAVNSLVVAVGFLLVAGWPIVKRRSKT